MKRLLFLVIITSSQFATAQGKIYSKTGTVSFFSKAPIENIEARNRRLLSVWNTATGQIELSALMKGFEFEKALMQEHFNQDYVESDKFPKSTFAGKINDAGKLSLHNDGVSLVTISGILTLHGISKPLQVPANITVSGGKISAACSFTIKLSDYNIIIPALVKDNISNVVTIRVTIPSFQSL